MNIKQVKEQIEKTIKVYLQKNDIDEYIISHKKQRPIFILGAPGIGKTAIMEQIAQEMNIGIISYSMTHHTRQSAIGLPYIADKNFDGMDTKISEYSMSEIIGSVYKLMEETGRKEGILFLDEINCISETLAPTMLQFLQMKKFGTHSLPQGWVIVTAGNPPQYNRSVREFDIATLDRLKVLKVTPDYDCWREYAISNSIHGSIISYLDMKKSDFYMIESELGKKSYVTARGWEDLSKIIYLYEMNGYVVDESLVLQYISNTDIAGDFSIYYDIYNRYKSDYDVENILAGIITDEVREKAKILNYDERMSILSILINIIHSKTVEYLEMEDIIKNIKDILLFIKEDVDIKNGIKENMNRLDKELNMKILSNAIGDEARKVAKKILKILNAMYKAAAEDNDFLSIKNIYNKNVDDLYNRRKHISDMLDNLFKFIEDVWGVSKEIIILVNDLTMNANMAKFIIDNGCDKYYKYNEKLLISDQKENLYNQVLEHALF